MERRALTVTARVSEEITLVNIKVWQPINVLENVWHCNKHLWQWT